MVTPFEPDLRRMRAISMTNLVLSALAPWIADDNRRSVAYRLEDLFMEVGIDVVTDEDRRKAGLKPRGERGWTSDELKILEQKRLEVLLAPIQTIITKDDIIRNATSVQSLSEAWDAKHKNS